MANLSNDLEDVQQQLGYWFNNEHLLLQAFTRSSYSAQYGGENNEVLEFIGDRVLDFYVVKIIANTFGFTKSQSEYYDGEALEEFCIVANKNEADFTELKKEIVSNRTLARKIDDLGFAKYLYMGDSDIQNHVEKQEKVKADLFEAILGAIAIDSEWHAKELEEFVYNVLDLEEFFDEVDTEEERPEKFTEELAINTLKELAEHGKCSIPIYELPDQQVYQDGQTWWKCTCTVNSWGIREVGLGKTKKIAKKYAAYLVLCNHYGLKNEYEEE
ncbi:MAG: hypothetical protein K6E21_02075 [Bacilli bacterium]|nr:hypothetical protein [Bacilli bacterium]